MSSSIPPSTPGRSWQPPTAEELQPELPQYEITGLLGRGGMGAVYRARQKSLKRDVAIKVLPPAMEDNDMRFVERFKAEAESMARLNHPGIVAVYDAGETPGGLLYIVMEFVEGTDVAHMIARSGRLPPDHAHAIAAHVCDALAYAHDHGLIHRDIKPANIMVDTQGRVKVADFGLAKAANDNSGFTQSNMAVGTPDFVAPEAFIPGLPLDGRADLYAVGVMMYQMLTGNIPRGAFKPVSALVNGIDSRFDQIVLKAMQTDREERHGSAPELREHLDTLLLPATPAPDQERYSSAGMPNVAVLPQDEEGIRTRQNAGPGASPAPRPRRPASASAPPRAKSKMPLFLGLGAAGALAVGAFLVSRNSDSGMATPAPEPPVSESVTTPAKAPVVADEAPKPMPASPASATRALKDGLTNSLGMKFVPVPGTDVLFCVHEVRWKDYAAFAAETPGVDASWKGQSADGFTLAKSKEEHPVTRVTWEESQAFCAWLSKKEGRTYRLPTDKEWSYAVDIGPREEWTEDATPALLSRRDLNEFPWGGEFPPKSEDQAGNYSDQSRNAKGSRSDKQIIEGYADGYPTTAPVMSFKPNKLGLYDLGGNVREWVEDWYDQTQKGRVLRGGSWISLESVGMRSVSRNYAVPDYRNDYGGFRCALVAPPQSP